MGQILKIVILSLLPISELRGGIPVGLASGLSIPTVYLIAVISNSLVFPIFYLFLSSVHHLFMRFRLYRKTFEKFLEKTRKRTHSKIEKYGFLGLTLFVAIPLPITGAYTGTLAAWFFEMDIKKSFLAVLLGVVIAGIIVSLVCILGIHFLDIFIKSNV
ncbi:small multi-drug export protein [candidate division WOR-3 bacterium]|nr:small multi-drug export protein [candidate division WOR-3 bacterium]MCK4527985.1 small multi-drug export protein [candidate division WOR-3 bacterium]